MNEVELNFTCMLHTIVVLPIWSKQRVLSTITTILLEFNLFKSAKHTQAQDLTRQRWSTRLFIIFLCIAVFIITTYNSINQQIKTVVVNNPRLDTIEKWQADSMVALSLRCPCSQISSPYKNFIRLTPKYHQICSSYFITLEWMDSINAAANIAIHLYFADFRASSDFFKLLQSLCTFANNTISNALISFGNTHFVTAEFLKRQVFENQMNTSAESFIQSTVNEFMHLVHLLANVTQINQFITGAYTNFDVELANYSDKANNTFYPYLKTASLLTINSETISCYCMNDTWCKIQVGIYTASKNTYRNYSVP
ncbi:unnamed protein product, partial [Rotaria sp. Silwood1]